MSKSNAAENVEQLFEEEEVELTAEELLHNAIVESFDESVTDELDEDATKMAMIQAGATYKNVTRLYNQFMIDAGLAISKADRNDLVESTLEGKEFDTEESFESVVIELVEAIKGTTERSAAALVRAYAKKNELEAYAAPKGDGATRNPFVTNFHNALIENPNMDEDGLKAVIAALPAENQTNPNRWFTQHNNIRKMANAIAAKLDI